MHGCTLCRKEKDFDDKKPNILSLIAYVLASLRDRRNQHRFYVKFLRGSMYLIFHGLGINGKIPGGLYIFSISWNPHPQGWIKVNIDGAVRGALGTTGCGGILSVGYLYT